MSVLGLLIIAGLLGATAMRIYQYTGLRSDAARFLPPGRLIDIGSCRLHIDSTGKGTPPVIFESGIGATSLSWRLVQPEIAKRTQAISYDRSGLGWSEGSSDHSARPRDLSQVIQELRDLLQRADVPSPRILVAHSYGGLVAIAYGARYREELAGIVFVDPVAVPSWSEPSETDRAMLHRGIALARRGAMLTRWGVTRLALGLLSGGARRVPEAIARVAGSRGSGFIDRMVGQVQKLPPEVLPLVQSHWCNPKSFEGMAAYLEKLPASAAEAMRDLPKIDDVPVIVLSAERASATEREWHAALAARTARGRMEIVAASGHWIQLDRPDAVIAAISELVNAVRRESRSCEDDRVG